MEEHTVADLAEAQVGQTLHCLIAFLMRHSISATKEDRIRLGKHVDGAAMIPLKGKLVSILVSPGLAT